MADVIFTKGTCLKNQVYQTMIDAFIAAGWKNISSNNATDFDVLQSVGESGDKNLIIQIRPTNASNANSIVTTDLNVASYRLIESYTPGTAGAAGVVGRTAEAWATLYVVPITTAVAGATPITYHINVNKNRMIIVIDTPPSVNLGPVTHYIGHPDTVFVSTPGSRGLLVASSAYAKATGVHVTNTPGEVAPETVSSGRAIYCQLSPRNPNAAGLFAFSEMKYGNATEGYLGKLDGLYPMPAGGASNGDTVSVGDKKFRVVVNQTVSTNSFPTSVFVIQIP